MTKYDMYEMLHNIQKNFYVDCEWEINTEFPCSEKYENQYGLDIELCDKFAISMLDLKRLLKAANITWNTNTFKGKWVCITIFKSCNNIIISIN